MFKHQLTCIMAGVQFNEQTNYAGVDEVVEEWPAASFVNTEIRVFQEAGGERRRGASSVESSRSRRSAWCVSEA